MATNKSMSDTNMAQARQMPLNADILNSVDESDVLYELNKCRLGGGRRTYRLVSMWRSYLLSFLLNLHNTNDLWRRLDDSPELRLMCGFGQSLPNRRAFNRFIERLSNHADLVTECIAPFVDDLRAYMPGLGEKIAIDSSVVKTHAYFHKRTDLDATWTIKNQANAKNNKAWAFGYKLHLVVDTTYEVPLCGFVTTASRSDNPTLPHLLEQLERTYSWVEPKYVMADRGYDSVANHKAVMERGATLIAPTRRLPVSKTTKRPGLYEGVFTEKGVPTCLGQLSMKFVRSDPEKGHLYRCAGAGCQLKERKGVVYCEDEYWVTPEEQETHPRLFPAVRRDSLEWSTLYAMRQSVERVFKSLKQSRRLEAHCVRGMEKVNLHIAMAMLAYTATLWVQTTAGTDDPRWMVQRAA